LRLGHLRLGGGGERQRHQARRQGQTKTQAQAGAVKWFHHVSSSIEAEIKGDATKMTRLM
jgi:hypothetical protein